MSSFRKPITVQRQNGGYVNGKWVATSPTPMTIMGSVQPATAKDMRNLPEGRRTSAAYAIFTDTELLTSTEGATPKKADQMTIFGDVCEAMSVAPWQNDVINHYRAVVAKIG